MKDLWCLEQNEFERQCFSEDMCSLKQRLVGIRPGNACTLALGDCRIWDKWIWDSESSDFDDEIVSAVVVAHAAVSRQAEAVAALQGPRRHPLPPAVVLGDLFRDLRGHLDL